MSLIADFGRTFFGGGGGRGRLKPPPGAGLMLLLGFGRTLDTLAGCGGFSIGKKSAKICNLGSEGRQKAISRATFGAVGG